MACFGQASTRDQADVSATDYRNLQWLTPDQGLVPTPDGAADQSQVLFILTSTSKSTDFEFNIRNQNLPARSGGLFPHQQAAQAEQHKPGLAKDNIPQETRGFIAIDFTEGAARTGVEQINQLGVVLLLETVQRATDQPVRVKFPP